mmetsp:Transcript_9979/g.19016  ORF Transcript_9979/g.19016 Transcript_9979/m.19016 type:complete len:228 (-) Transcript_9979:2507-3190(-)
MPMTARIHVRIKLWEGTLRLVWDRLNVMVAGCNPCLFLLLLIRRCWGVLLVRRPTCCRYPQPSCTPPDLDRAVLVPASRLVLVQCPVGDLLLVLRLRLFLFFFLCVLHTFPTFDRLVFMRSLFRLAFLILLRRCISLVCLVLLLPFLFFGLVMGRLVLEHVVPLDHHRFLGSFLALASSNSWFRLRWTEHLNISGSLRPVICHDLQLEVHDHERPEKDGDKAQCSEP